MEAQSKSPLDRLAEVAGEHSEGMVERALDTAREMLGMEMAYLSMIDIEADRQTFKGVTGDASFGVTTETELTLDQSYCQKLLDGRIDNIVPDTSKEPAIAELDATKDGEIGAYVGVPVEFSDGSLCGTLCCVSHHTDPAVADRDVRFMHLLARLVADDIERQQLRQETDQLKDDFLALTTHELQTPLASIAGYTEMLREDETENMSEEARSFLDAIDRSSTRLTRLVQQLLFVAQAQADRLPDEHEVLDLAEVSREAVAHVPAGDVEVSVEAPAAVMVDANHDQLVRMVENLVSNAIKYSPDGGTATVSIEQQAAGAILSVKDTGIGIPAEEQGKLFSRFFRSSNAKGAGISGAGLGLWIVKEIADRHGGAVAVDSGEGEGTTMRVALPVAAT